MKSHLQRGAYLFVILAMLGVFCLPGAAQHARSGGQGALAQEFARAQRELGPQPQFREQVAKFYSEAGEEPAWVRGGQLTPQGQALVQLFEHAAEKGLRPRDYGDWSTPAAQLAAAKTAEQRMRIDLALTVAAMRYVSDLHFGRVAPEAMGFALGAREKRFDLGTFLATEVVHSADVAKSIAGAEPAFDGYWRTLAALDRLEAVAKEGKFEPLPVPKRSVHPGETYAAVAELVVQLRRMWDLPPNARLPENKGEYGGAIVEAVKRFQGRHGLEVDGVLGRATIAALNVPLRDRIEQLELTLERWRWVPQGLALPAVVVNIPEFRFYVVDRDYRWLMVQKVIIGRSYQHKTPVFVGQMRSVIFRPFWNVPYSIQRKELVPKIARDHGYLARNDYEIVSRANRPVDVEMNGTTLAELRSGELKIRQKPGDKNALGLIKFEFPNRYDVYMHGTPAKSLFSSARRDFSHGCIRVEDPAALAAWLLRGVPGWTPEKIDAAMGGTETVKVDLPHPVTVVILYGTAVVTHDAVIRFMPDIYGYDARLEAALARPRERIVAGP